MTIGRAGLLFLSGLVACALFSAPASGQSASATVRSAPKIYLSQPLTASSPQEFARKLSALVGATITLPASAQVVLSLPAGSFTADDMVAATAKMLGSQLGVGVHWRRSFVLAHADASASAVPFRLSSAGMVSYACKDAAFGDAANAIAAKAHCGVEVPSGVSGLYRIDVAQVSAESAMRQLAAQAGLTLSVRVIYDLDKPAGDTRAAMARMSGDNNNDPGDDPGSNDADVAVSADSTPVDLDTPADSNVSDQDIANLSAWALNQANLADGDEEAGFADWLANTPYYAGGSGSDSGGS